MCYWLDMVEEKANEPGGDQPQGQENQLDRGMRDLVFQHSVLCQTCLPYRDPGPGVRVWERLNGHAHLEVLAGKAMHPEEGRLVELGLPFGPKPRLIVAYLNTEALRTRSPEIEVEASLTAFAKRLLGYDPNGHEIRLFKDQLARLAAASIRLGLLREGRAITVNTQIVTAFDLWFPKDERQRVPWPATVRLSLDYFESLQRHAVPLHERALVALAHNAMALDVYAWLAQRLHRVDPGKPQLVPWKALKDQFGQGYGRLANFRRDFLATLRLVLGQYPGARLEVDERGLTLRHSLPPVLCRHSPIIPGSKGPR
jgi:Plasmid encoded RepA protein